MKYKQLNLLGKGNYGKAFKVRLNDGKEGGYFVAKRIFLEGLSEQQIKGAFGQIQILKKINQLDFPFIVNYKQFFRIENQLIIIMEYCECGDLTTILKSLKNNNERLEERIIAYWFIQLLFGVRALHIKNILHRDLKSANIFITKNYSLKIGDFGISKILEHSSAITCIGTPLYLSPQVCNNQPYGLSSDLWALGCIMYELCALRFPFEAGNLIVLAKKIVMDEVAPIPDYYSQELNDIIMKMFIKNNKERITIDQIFNSQYIKNAMKSFIKDQGNLKSLAVPIQNQSNKQQESAVKGAQDTMKTINSVVEQTQQSSILNYTKSLTPSQLRLQRKEQKTMKEIQLLKKATREAATMKAFAKQSKQRNQKGAIGSYGQQSKKKELLQMIQTENKNKINSKKTQVFQKFQKIDTLALANAMKTMVISEIQYEDLELSGDSSHIPINKTQKKNADKSDKKQNFKQEKFQNYQEEIPQIVQPVQEDENLQEYYDDFQDYQEETKETKEEKDNILAYYQNEVQIDISPTKKARINRVWKEDIKPLQSAKKIDSLIQQCCQKVGKPKFQELYQKVQQNKIDRSNQKHQFSIYQRDVLRKIDEILFYEKS